VTPSLKEEVRRRRCRRRTDEFGRDFAVAAPSVAWVGDMTRLSVGTGAVYIASGIAAGDADGDGAADILVGSMKYESTRTDQGRATLFYSAD
jgi:hypothetical protein